MLSGLGIVGLGIGGPELGSLPSRNGNRRATHKSPHHRAFDGNIMSISSRWNAVAWIWTLVAIASICIAGPGTVTYFFLLFPLLVLMPIQRWQQGERRLSQWLVFAFFVASMPLFF